MLSDWLVLEILIYCTTSDDIPTEDNAVLTCSLVQKQNDSLCQVSVSNIRAHILLYKFPPHPCFPTALFTHPLCFFSLVWRKRALVNQQRDTDP